MLQLSKTELQNFKSFPNSVLIKPNRGENEIILPNGMKLLLDISFEKNMHAPVVGTVMSVPEYLDPKYMQWDCDMELLRGDTVCYSYEAATAALENDEGRLVESEGQVYFIIPYEEIFVAKRSHELDPITGNFVSDSPYHKIVPVNGYLLVEPVEEKLGEEMSKYLAGTNREILHSERFGRVAYKSTGKIRKYNDGDGKPDNQDVKPGDYICFARGCDQLCEYDLHTTLLGNKKFFRMQRRYVLAVIPSHFVKNMQ